MEEKLVSVIMPAYNGERFIAQAIESVLMQAYSNWELIVVDDGSTDQTSEIISTFHDRRIVYIHQENRGQAAALNRGLESARGEYITTLDIDDWFTSNSLGDRAIFLANHPEYDVVYGDGFFCDPQGNQLQRFSELRTGEVVGDVFDVILSNSFFGTGANVMVRKSALEKYSIRYDESIVWCQDYDLYLRLAEKCSFGYVDSLMVWYRLHQGNMTMTMPAGRRRDSLLRTKLKVLESKRFSQTPANYKVAFFHHFIIQNLDNDIRTQMELMDHPGFKSLPKPEQAKLIRSCASGYLAVNKCMEEVRSLLNKSWKLNPFDLKTYFVIFLAYFNVGPVEWIFNYWRKLKLRSLRMASPFDHIKE
jgi:glycosyltransferase involved in cell wall biosynthesis